MGARERALAYAVQRHLKPVFTLALYLAKCNMATAYQVTLESFGEIVHHTLTDGEQALLRQLLQAVVRRCRGVTPTSFPADAEFFRLLEVKKDALPFVRQALFLLDFDSRALVLLRDQINVSYEDIGAILGLDPKKVKLETAAARVRLRDKMEEVLNRVKGPP